MTQCENKFADNFSRCKFFQIDENGETILTVFISNENWEDSFAIISLGDIHLTMFAESENYVGEHKNRSFIAKLKTLSDFGMMKFSEIETNSVNPKIKQHLMDIWSKKQSK